MKHSSIIINIVFGFAIVILFIMYSHQKHSGNTSEKESKPVSMALADSNGNIVIKEFPVAYIILDSLMHNYLYYKKIETQYQNLVKQEDAKLQQQGAMFQQEVEQLQSHVQNGLITSKDAAARDQELQIKQQQLMQLQESKQNELAKKEETLMKELRDSVEAVVKYYNRDNKYEIVLNNVFNSNVLYAKEHLNITDTILQIMNTRYTKSTGKK
jgi:outer membrane protein